MISYLKGRIISKRDKFIVLDVNNVGYKAFLSKKSLEQAKEQEEKEIFCFLDVKENSMNLYGFFKKEELEFFEILNSIRGIGPKAALEISSLGPIEKIKEKILKHDLNLFDSISGIGKKKARAIILELSGKIENFSDNKKTTDEAEDALVNLGFLRKDAKEALEKIPKDIEKSEERIKKALKLLG